MKDMNVKLKHLISLSIVTLICAVKSAGGNSLLPEGFDSEDADSKKRSAEDQKVLSAEGLAVKDDIKIEFGEGHGETTDEALKEAMKDVLQKVVGVYVDSDFRVNNDEIIQDEIITHSNGFIDHYKKMDEEDDKNGRGKVVTIKAWVKMRDFVNRMKKIAPSQKVKVDGLLMYNELGNNLNAEALLRKEFENFDPIMDLMEVKLIDSVRPSIQSSTDDSVVLRYAYIVKYSNDKYYKKFLPRISALLDQLADKKVEPKKVSYEVVKVDAHPRKSGPINHDKCWESCSVSAYLFLAGMRGSVWPVQNGKRIVFVSDSISRNGVVSVRGWVLSEHLYAIYQEYRRKFQSEERKVNCVFTLLVGWGGMLSQEIDEINARGSLFEDAWGEGHNPDFLPIMGAVSAVAWLSNVHEIGKHCHWPAELAHIDRYVGYIDITIDKKDILKIKSAEIKLETNKKESEQ